MRIIKLGSRGKEVKTLQTMLGITADGIFGKATRAAVIEYQTEHGLDADGIVGVKTWTALNGTQTATTVVNKQPKDLKQYDSRWKNVSYTSTGSKTQTIGSSGCGVCAMCDILATVVDANITPPTIAALFVKNGFRTANNGTAWGAFAWTANKYGFTAFKRTADIAVAQKYLRAGAYVVCNMGKGYWTTGGHYICAWKCDETYMYANDPASAKRTKQALTAFASECKQYFCFIK